MPYNLISTLPETGLASQLTGAEVKVESGERIRLGKRGLKTIPRKAPLNLSLAIPKHTAVYLFCPENKTSVGVGKWGGKTQEKWRNLKN